MVKYILAFSLLMATPARAEPVNTTSMQVVSTAAKTICPQALQTALETHDPETAINNVVKAAKMAGLSDEEVLLLLDLCNSYQQGVLDGMHMKTSV